MNESLETQTRDSTEADLVALAQQGDTAAQTQLIRTVMPKIVALAYTFGGMSAQDLVQDALLHLVEKRLIEEYDLNSNASFSSYIYGVSKRRMIDYARRENLRRMEPLPQDHSENVSHENRTPERLLIEEERKAIIKEVLNTLDPQDRKILELRHGNEDHPGHTSQEIAQEEGCTKNTIDARDYKARAQMRTALVATNHRLNRTRFPRQFRRLPPPLSAPQRFLW